jgi:hypothetical protein
MGSVMIGDGTYVEKVHDGHNEGINDAEHNIGRFWMSVNV